MCTVATAVSSLIVGALSIYSKVQSSNVQAAQAEYNANVARQNAELARKNAAFERQEALEEARNTRIQNLQKTSKLKANIAAGNIALGSDYASDIIDTMQISGELDALNTLDTGERNAQKYLLSADNYDKKADMLISNEKARGNKNTVALLGSGLDTIF